MIDYTGLHCPACQQPFRETDDIVVCPECGAPHHRECFAKTGRCAMADKHGTPDDWSHQEHPRQVSLTKECPRCHAMNEEEALFCKECGQSLHYYSKTADGNPASSAHHTPPSGQSPFPGQTPPAGSSNTSVPFDPLGGVSPNEQFDGVSAANLAKAVQTNIRYYLLVFARIKTSGRSRFNFAAFFFGGAWYLFRKQYLLGTIFLLINLALTTGTVLMQTLYVLPLLHSLDPNIATNFSFYNINQLVPKIMELGGIQTFLCILPLIFYAARFALRMIMGAKANRLYLHRCVRVVKDAVDYTGFASPEEKIQKKGGVNTLLITILMTVYIVVYFLMHYLPR